MMRGWTAGEIATAHARESRRGSYYDEHDVRHAVRTHCAANSIPWPAEADYRSGSGRLGANPRRRRG